MKEKSSTWGDRQSIHFNEATKAVTHFYGNETGGIDGHRLVVYYQCVLLQLSTIVKIGANSAFSRNHSEGRRK